MDSSSFEFMFFQSNFLAAIEELKFRRESEEENETKIRELIIEKHKLEREMEHLKKLNEEDKDRYDEETANLKRNYEIQLLQNNEEKTKNAIMIEALNNESKLLKREVDRLNLEKLTNEKRIKALEGQLVFQDNLQQSVLNQASSVKKLAEDLQGKYDELMKTQTLTEQHVHEASHLCQAMQADYAQQVEQIRNLTKDKEGLKAQLIQLRSTMASKHNEESVNASNKTLKVTLDLKRQTAINEELQRRVEQLQTEIKDLTEVLARAHELLNNRVEREQEVNDRMKALNERLDEFRDLHRQLRAENQQYLRRIETLQDQLRTTEPDQDRKKRAEGADQNSEPDNDREDKDTSMAKESLLTEGAIENVANALTAQEQTTE